jgi:hypothetical protein
VSFSCVNHSRFLVPTHNIHGMIISKKKGESKLMFLQCTVAVVYPTLSFLKKSNKITFLECTVAGTSPYFKHPYNHNASLKWGILVGQWGWWGSIYGLCIDHDGVRAVKREMNVNLNQSRVLSQCMQLSREHDAILLCAHLQAWWTEYFEVWIGAVSSET